MYSKSFLQNSQKNTCARAFYDKLAGWRLATLLKKRLFLWMLQNFSVQLFYKTPPMAASDYWIWTNFCRMDFYYKLILFAKTAITFDFWKLNLTKTKTTKTKISATNNNISITWGSWKYIKIQQKLLILNKFGVYV